MWLITYLVEMGLDTGTVLVPVTMTDANELDKLFLLAIMSLSCAFIGQQF